MKKGSQHAIKVNITIDRVLVVLLSRLSDEIRVDNDFDCVLERKT